MNLSYSCYASLTCGYILSSAGYSTRTSAVPAVHQLNCRHIWSSTGYSIKHLLFLVCIIDLPSHLAFHRLQYLNLSCSWYTSVTCCHIWSSTGYSWGTVPEPLLFLVYISDLLSHLEFHRIQHLDLSCSWYTSGTYRHI